MKSLARVPRPVSEAQTWLTRQREVADHQGGQEQSEQGDRQATADRHRSATEPPSDRADGLDAGPIGGLHGSGTLERRTHSSASFRRRTSAMKTGAPIIAVTTATCSSPGRATTRPRMSAPSSRIGASSIEYGSAHR